MNKYPQYNTPLFSEIYPSIVEFINDYNNLGIPTTITVNSATTLYYLLYAYHGNDPIRSVNVDQFKFKLFSIVFQYAPTWEKRLDIQKNLRNLSDEELRTGAKSIYNHASHPGTAPSTGALQELEYIDDQNTASVRKNVIDAYRNLWEMLKVDVTKVFLDQFKILFKVIVTPQRPVLYESEE